MDNSRYYKEFDSYCDEYGYKCPKIYVYDTIDSTNDELKRLADNGAPNGTTVIANSQSNGHGRSGRSFYSPEGGNLYISFLLRPNGMDSISMITPMAAVATARAIEKASGITVGIKWVNDLIHNKKKVCGIIAQGYELNKSSRHIIVGIGVNVHVDPAKVPADIKDVYGVLLGGDTDEDEVASVISKIAAGIFHEFMSIYNNPGDITYMDEYRSRSICIGRVVSYISGDNENSAKVVDIDNAGGLIVELEDGSVKTYRDGEIRIRL